jgi:hypothetical protein
MNAPGSNRIYPARQKNRERVYAARPSFSVTRGMKIKTVRIVGIDDARSELSEVSWISPVAKALLKAGEGDIVEVRTPWRRAHRGFDDQLLGAERSLGPNESARQDMDLPA